MFAMREGQGVMFQKRGKKIEFKLDIFPQFSQRKFPWYSIEK